MKILWNQMYSRKGWKTNECLVFTYPIATNWKCNLLEIQRSHTRQSHFLNLNYFKNKYL